MKRNYVKHRAFGIEPSTRKYRLRLARYVGLAETVADFVRKTTTGPKDTVRLLDAGSGSGRTYRYLESHGINDQIEFHAIDYNANRLPTIYAAEDWDSIVEADLKEGIPYDDASFDIVICEQVIEHLPDPDQVIGELVRVLRKGGLLIVGVPTFPPGIASLRRHLVPALDRITGKERGHAQVFTAQAIQKKLEAAPGITVSKVRGFRLMSGGLLAYLENFRWWYRLHRRLGRMVPSLCTEVQVIARRLSCLFLACENMVPLI